MWQEGTGVERRVRRSDRRRPPIEGHDGTRAVLVRVARRLRWRGTRRGGFPTGVVALGQEGYPVVGNWSRFRHVSVPRGLMPNQPQTASVAARVNESIDGEGAV